MRLTRRGLLAASLALPALTRAGAAEARTLRVGFQKGEPILMAARQHKALEAALGPQGWTVTWTEFQFGPPMLEAMRVGSIDLGGVGDTPPVFAQAAGADLSYVAADGAGISAILLPPNSKVQTLADLKGKRIAFGRGSSAHNFLLMTLEKAGLTYDQIQPVALGPADAGAAFERGAIDAWSIWDPYIALFETRPGVRMLASSKDIGIQHSYFLAARHFAEANPQAVTSVVEAFTKTATWAGDHRNEVAHLLSDATGLPLEAEQRAVNRAPFTVEPMTPALIQSQQKVADRFHKLNIIPKTINVADAVWRGNA